MAILINEVLANPVGKDTEGEFVELYNSGREEVSLAGWRLEDKSGKSFKLDGYKVAEGGYLELKYETTKITLNNSDEVLYLYRREELEDKVVVAGQVLEGESLARRGESWIFTEKITPGAENEFREEALQATAVAGEVVNKNGIKGVVLTGVVVGILMGAVAVYIYRKLESKNQENYEDGYHEIG